jgi:threonylcarbamoyladenosine tRNA methylthiotransferase MtaB
MNKKFKVALTTLGCKLNYSETSTISRQFTDNGYELVKFDEFSNLYVINTCSVTENADKQFKSFVKKALKINSNAFIVAIGCYAQLKPKELASVSGVDLVLGSNEKFKILDYLNDLSKNDFGEIHSC